MYDEEFDVWKIGKELKDFIVSVLSKGDTILEFGSGRGTQELADAGFKMISIEENKDFIGKYDSEYIHAPIKHRWYDIDAIKRGLPKKYGLYKLILVDGPVFNPDKHITRDGFFENINLFDKNAIIVFDDIDRPHDFDLFRRVEKYTKKTSLVGKCASGKFYGVLL